MATVRAWQADDRGARTTDSPDGMDRELRRIRGEYLEMPGLCLTQCQAQRLLGLSCDRCEALLTLLIKEGFLIRTADGRFIRYGGDSDR